MSELIEQKLREQLVYYGRSLFMRGFSSGGSGNISVKLAEDRFWSRRPIPVLAS